MTDGENTDSTEVAADRPRTEGVRILGAQEARALVEGRTASIESESASQDKPATPAAPVTPVVAPPVAPPVVSATPTVPPVPAVAKGPSWSAASEVGEPAPVFQGSKPQGFESRESGEPSGALALPHWTEPPTGEMPKISLGDDSVSSSIGELSAFDGGADDGGGVDDAWADLVPGTARFRADAADWAQADFALGSTLKDDDTALGALAEDTSDDEAFERSLAERRGILPAEPGPVPSAPVERPMTLEPDRAVPKVGVPAGPSRGRDMKSAVATGIATATVALLAFSGGRFTAALFIALLVGLGTAEFYAAVHKCGYRPATLLGICGSSGLVVAAYFRGDAAFPLVTMIVVVYSLLWYLIGVARARPTVNVAMTLLGYAYVGMLGGFAGLILQYPNGVGVVIGFTLCIVAYDVAGLFVGSTYGHARLAPTISPNKTVEGLAGGMAASVAAGGILGVVGGGMAPWDGGSGLLLGVVIAVVAPLGDLCESMIKRDFGMKDLGHLLPGHGGVMDRFDAIFFAAPAAYYLIRFLNIG